MRVATFLLAGKRVAFASATTVGPMFAMRALFVLVSLFWFATALGAQAGKDFARDNLRADEFFGRGTISDFRITLDDAAREAIRKEPRKYVKATLLEGTKVLGVVGIKLKGAVGSFQEFDARPAITVNVDKFTVGQSCHGLLKFHLNNSVQDDSLLSEMFGSEVFRAAGIPAARVTHASLHLDDRDLGVYVLKEGFDARFLERNFGTSNGSLYDGGFCQEIDADLEKDIGDKTTSSDRAALVEACRIKETSKRGKELPAVLDIEAFITFSCLERMLAHWDGYLQSRNNYRLYFDANGHGQFLPHGMDQLLGDAEATVLATPESLVGAAVLKLSNWRARYRARLVELLPVLRSAEIRKRIEAAIARLRKIVGRRDQDGGQGFGARAADFIQRLDQRCRNLERELKAPEPKPLELAPMESASIDDWLAARTTENARLAATPVDGIKALKVSSQGKGACTGSWRANVLLKQGHYRLEAKVKLKDVVGSGDVAGVLLRRSGDATSPQRISGTQTWQKIEHEFVIADTLQEVVLVAELKSSSGQVWFRRDAFRLVRLPD